MKEIRLETHPLPPDPPMLFHVICWHYRLISRTVHLDNLKMYLTGIPLDLTTERFLGKSSENQNERVIFPEMTRKLLENKGW